MKTRRVELELMPETTRAWAHLFGCYPLSQLPGAVGAYLETHPEELRREVSRIGGPYAEAIVCGEMRLQRLDYADGFSVLAEVPADPSWCL